MLVIGRFTKQNKFSPVVRFDPRDENAIEVRFEGYDTIGITLSREQYAEFRRVVGGFNPVGTPPPRPTPPPSPASDDWGS